VRSRKILLSATFGGAVLLGLTAAPAWAHVEVQPSQAVKGEDATLAFRVPNEEDKANVVKLQVLLPGAVKDVTTRPLAGWTATVDGSTITWSGGQIHPQQFEEFALALALPTTDELVFKAVQTYDNGDVVRWVDPTPPGGAEPEHPAPVLHLVTAAAATGAATPAADDDTSLVGPYALGAVAVLLAAAALLRARRRPAAG
jgi:uncharacterized protein YcnI